MYSLVARLSRLCRSFLKGLNEPTAEKPQRESLQITNCPEVQTCLVIVAPSREPRDRPRVSRSSRPTTTCSMRRMATRLSDRMSTAPLLLSRPASSTTGPSMEGLITARGATPLTGICVSVSLSGVEANWWQGIQRRSAERGHGHRVSSSG